MIDEKRIKVLYNFELNERMSQNAPDREENAFSKFEEDLKSGTNQMKLIKCDNEDLQEMEFDF